MRARARHRSHRRAVGQAVLVALLALAGTFGTAATVAPPPVGATRTSVPAPDCGRPLRKPDGTLWKCTFDDEFSGYRLDPAKWAPVRTDRQGFHDGPECYVADGGHVRVARGVLTLTATRTLLARRCSDEVTRYESGMVTSRAGFAQRYGRFAFRAAFPAGVGLHPALWMYPRRLRPGPWPRSGEIDVAEAYGVAPGLVSPHLHFVGADGTQHPGANCPVADTTSFHRYAVVWTPTRIVFRYDGKRCFGYRRWVPDPPMRTPAPFDRKFFLILELGLDGAGPNLIGSSTRLPARMQIDWVRVWR